jgi:hypothetical protein
VGRVFFCQGLGGGKISRNSFSNDSGVDNLCGNANIDSIGNTPILVGTQHVAQFLTLFFTAKAQRRKEQPVRVVMSASRLCASAVKKR